MNRIYVLETPLAILIQWEKPPNVPWKIRWDDRMYLHPDTDIFVGKSPSVKKRNHHALDNCVMNALQDAHMSVRALAKRPKRVKKYKTGCKSCEFVQLTLFDD